MSAREKGRNVKFPEIIQFADGYAALKSRLEHASVEKSPYGPGDRESDPVYDAFLELLTALEEDNDALTAVKASVAAWHRAMGTVKSAQKRRDGAS